LGFSGCPFEQKRRFVVTLMAEFKQDMNQSNVPAHAS
jgi:hypothetical protein